MLECEVDHAIRSGCSAAQTIEVVKRTAMHFSTRGGQRFSASIGSAEAEHLMSRFE